MAFRISGMMNFDRPRLSLTVLHLIGAIFLNFMTQNLCSFVLFIYCYLFIIVSLSIQRIVQSVIQPLGCNGFLIKLSIYLSYEKNNFIPCLTKQLLNVLKLWCEWGITLQLVVVVLNSNTKFRDNLLKFTFHTVAI